MNLAISKTRSAVGVVAQPVSVEVHLSNGLPSFTIVGLPETAVKESKDRVRSAIINSQFEFPCRRITVNLAPASLPKSGSGFDLPIALGILTASGQIPLKNLLAQEFIGELALDGSLRGVSAIIPVVLAVRKEKSRIIIAQANAEEASLTQYEGILTAYNLRQVCDYLCNDTPLDPLPAPPQATTINMPMDWSDVKGQIPAKFALEIAACGGHSMLMSGPPGSGKTMLAKRFSTILPDLSEEQALDCAAIQSIQGRLPNFSQWLKPPFRSPHHTASPVALVGGGNPPKPGEISLAHLGVLFLDELPEFNRHVLETLREPLESGTICISRAANQIEFPAQFQLIAAMNPCPCGQWGNTQANCFCSPDRINRYLSKLSAPLLDRIDLFITIQAIKPEELIQIKPKAEQESTRIKSRVENVRQQQIHRQQCLNANLNPTDCEKICDLGQAEQAFLGKSVTQLKLSARAYHRLLKVARTIADMRNAPRVELVDLQKAFAFKLVLQGSNTFKSE